MSVLMLHAGGFAPVPDVLRPYDERLDVAVAVSFLISGFLLSRPFE